MTYEDLLIEADKMGLVVKEKPLIGYNGRIKGKRIAIRKDIPTLKEKACVLSEEIGHHIATAGDILDQNKVKNRKQELKARAVAYDLQIGLIGFVKAYEAGCTDKHEIADYLGVTEPFLEEALESYQRKHGVYTVLDNYIIYFEPNLVIMKRM